MSANPREVLSFPRPAPLPESLVALAPLCLPNLRATRYLGDGQFAPLNSLAPADQRRMREVYAALNDLLPRLVSTRTDDAGKRRAVQEWVAQGRLAALVERVHALGRDTPAAWAQGGALARTLHDVRGGALSSLVGRLEMLDVPPGNLSEKLNVLFCLTRDHLKIMRNALVGLDDAQRDRDRTPKSHDASLLIRKWHNAVVGSSTERATVRMRVDCRYEGPVTECCLESAAIDRIFYNLANNARRHTADGDMEMVVFETPGDSLRFVLSNAVDSDQAQALRRMGRARDEPDGAGDSSGMAWRLDEIFLPVVSTTGSGLGLAIVAEFAAHAFGLKDAKQAVQEGYVGAVLEGPATFRAWFHWPRGKSGLEPKLDDYRRPGQSLSDG